MITRLHSIFTNKMARGLSSEPRRNISDLQVLIPRNDQAKRIALSEQKHPVIFPYFDLNGPPYQNAAFLFGTKDSFVFLVWLWGSWGWKTVGGWMFLVDYIKNQSKIYGSQQIKWRPAWAMVLSFWELFFFSFGDLQAAEQLIATVWSVCQISWLGLNR